jgi:hypothetical protein
MKLASDGPSASLIRLTRPGHGSKLRQRSEVQNPPLAPSGPGRGGERIVLARHGKPIAQLVPLDPSPRRQLGFLKGSVDEAIFEPLPDDELERWGA